MNKNTMTRPESLLAVAKEKKLNEGPSMNNDKQQAYPSLYERTGDIKDINTMLVPLSHLSDAQKKEEDQAFAGLLFDFMGFLTTHETRWKFSAYDDATPGVQALEQFAEKRGLSLDEPDISGWKSATPPAAAEAPAIRTDRSQPWTVEHLRNYPQEAVALLNEHLSTPTDSAEAKAQPLTELAWDALTEAFIDAYLEDYEMIGEAPDGRDACHTPDEGEKELIKDAVMGLLSEAYEHARNGIASSTKDGGNG